MTRLKQTLVPLAEWMEQSVVMSVILQPFQMNPVALTVSMLTLGHRGSMWEILTGDVWHSASMLKKKNPDWGEDKRVFPVAFNNILRLPQVHNQHGRSKHEVSRAHAVKSTITRVITRYVYFYSYIIVIMFLLRCMYFLYFRRPGRNPCFLLSLLSTLPRHHCFGRTPSAVVHPAPWTAPSSATDWSVTLIRIPGRLFSYSI